MATEEAFYGEETYLHTSVIYFPSTPTHWHLIWMDLPSAIYY